MPKLSFLSSRAADAGLAAFAALSAGFVAFAMPEPLFSAMVETSRLPSLVPAAEPPLGETARMAAAGAAALLAFAPVWALMAALGRKPAPRKPALQAEAEAPRLRRADAHPDAPARRPLLARDLGEPLDLEDHAEAPADAQPGFGEPERPLPSFLVPQPAPIAQAEPDLGPPEPWQAEPEWNSTETQWFEPGLEPDPEPEAESRGIPELAARLPEAGEESDQPLSQLVNRIEFGLSRKRQALPAAAADLPPVEASPAEPEKVGHRLRSAINDLQKIASGGA